MSELNYEVIAGNPERVAVFLHGLMGRGKNFLQNAKALTATTTAILVDQPNHGDSAWTTEFSYQQMADAVAALLRQLPEVQRVGKVHLVGHSMGGKTAMMLALLHPELLHSLTIVDISPTPAAGTAPFNSLLGPLLQLDLMSLRTRREAHDQLQAAIPDDTMRNFLLANLVKQPSSFRYRWLANVRLLFNSLPQIVGFEPPTVTSFAGPVLWLAGSDSNYVKQSDLPLMSSLFPDVIPVAVPGAGHWVHADQPAEFERLVREFITAEA